MTKQERAKMEKCFHEAVPWLTSGHVDDQRQIMDACASEVDRAVAKAVRAERRAQRDTEELWASKRRRTEDQLVERAKGLGRKRP